MLSHIDDSLREKMSKHQIGSWRSKIVETNQRRDVGYTIAVT